MSDWNPTTTLLKYTNSSGFFSDFKIDNSGKEVSFDYPSALYNDAMGNGLSSYTYESASLVRWRCFKISF
ncbi:MAG: hypothetical protein V8T43_10900 [Eubacteriales bacterium]